jgi:hypothetical protein
VAKIDVLFVKLCREKFQFLVDEFAFRRVTSATRSGPGYVLYTNSTTGVGIGYDRRDGYLSVDPMRLVEGKPPASGGFRHHQPLWTLIRLRAGTPPGISDRGGVRTEPEIAVALSADAAALKANAADILRGDFSVFPELERLRAEDWGGGAAGGGGAAAP